MQVGPQAGLTFSPARFAPTFATQLRPQVGLTCNPACLAPTLGVQVGPQSRLIFSPAQFAPTLGVQVGPQAGLTCTPARFVPTLAAQVGPHAGFIVSPARSAATLGDRVRPCSPSVLHALYQFLDSRLVHRLGSSCQQLALRVLAPAEQNGVALALMPALAWTNARLSALRPCVLAMLVVPDCP